LTEVSVPPSKSITNRALVLAALSDPRSGSTLHCVLRSEDTEVMIAALRQLGFQVHENKDGSEVRVCRGERVLPVPASEADLYVGNSGTTMRFLTALVSLGKGSYRLDGVSRMRERPIEDLLGALRQLGVRAETELGNGLSPVRIEANGLNGGQVHIRGDLSSQFLSGLLMAAPLARGDVAIELEGRLVSQPYAAMTVQMMREFGATVETDLQTHFHVLSHPWYERRDYAIEPDATAASYFFAAAAISRGEITVRGLGRRSLQGDLRFIDVLCEMGCRAVFSAKGVTVVGGPLSGIDVDMNAMSDCVMTLAAVACFAQGPTTIRNVAHVRHKESDRLAALAEELRKTGAKVREFQDGLQITPGSLHGAVFETYNDHRMAMSLALIGLVTPGIVLKNPGCVIKTYPAFFDDLERLRLHA
jgi:3-phosphoshikimate 1-carboxyvinyltransferase